MTAATAASAGGVVVLFLSAENETRLINELCKHITHS